MSDQNFVILPDETIVNLEEISRIDRSHLDHGYPEMPPTWTVRVHLRGVSEDSMSYHFSSKEKADALYNRLKVCIEETAVRVYLTDL